MRHVIEIGAIVCLVAGLLIIAWIGLAPSLLTQLDGTSDPMPGLVEQPAGAPVKVNGR